MTDFSGVLRMLTDAQVEFILIGGVAATVHGSARSTQDIDVVYARSEENINRLVEALKPHNPYLRGAPPGLPFLWDSRTVSNGLNFTLLVSSLGAVDLLGEIPGGRYEDLLPHSTRVRAYGVECLCLDLPTLIRVKRAAGRPKDFEAIAELELLAEKQQSDPESGP